MQNYKMTIQYNGTKFNGWQKQGNTDNTIQGKLEYVLSEFAGSKVLVHGAGRTDAGVHARGQVASFVLPEEKNINLINSYLCRYLPPSIAVTNIEIAEPRFNARLNAAGKKYVYRIWNSSIPNVFEGPFMYHYASEIDINLMIKAADSLKGENDYRAFCTNISKNKSSVRIIYDIIIEKINDEVRITYTGNGFLYNMIRILTGTLLEVGVGRIKEEDVKLIVLSKERNMAGPTLPGNGLILEEVYY